VAEIVDEFWVALEKDREEGGSGMDMGEVLFL
jgi:hypothetical protein